MAKMKISLGSPDSEEENSEVSSVHIDKIDNGFVVKTCGPMGEEQAIFMKNLMSAPSVIARIMGIKDKSGEEISKTTKVEEENTEY